MNRLRHTMSTVFLAVALSLAVGGVAGATEVGPPPTSRPHLKCDDERRFETSSRGRRRHHHHHGHHHHHDDDECGPLPVVPEVPLPMILPLSAAGIAGVVLTVHRRRDARLRAVSAG